MDEPNSQTLASPSPEAPGADEDWSGRSLGEFRILRLLGRGGMGQVYLAEQTSLKRNVAIKMLRPELAANKTALLRFRSEAEAVARLNHANIVQIYSIGEQDGVQFMALEYVEGRNLRDYLNRKGTPDLPVCLSLMRQIAAGLQRAHEAGFIHRDIKPENILLTRKGEAKVTDFGLTRCFAESGTPTNITQSGVAMGTPLYMSPEQVQGKPVDPRSDIYSFGVTCFALLAGSPPFRGVSAFDVAVQHVQNQPPALASLRPDLPSELPAMIHKMMAKNPDERYQTFKDVLRDLNRMRGSLSGAATLVPLALPTSGTISISSEFDNAITEPIRSPSRSRWFPRIVVGVVLASMFFGGMTVRLVRNRLQAKPAALANVPEKMQPIVSSEERFAIDAARQYADPNTSELRELKRCLDFQIDLAAHYFKRDRLDEADQFFRELRERKYKPMPKDAMHPFVAFGQLGQALVWAMRDQPQALAQIGNLVQPPQRPGLGFANSFQVAGVPGVLFEHTDLRRMLVDALNRIAAVQKVEKFEKYPHLDSVRKPSRPRPFAPGKG